MNILSTILDRLNRRIEVGNIFDQIYGLSELVGEGNDKAWAFYIGNGQAIPVTNYDAKQGTLFWAKRGKITVSKNDSLRLAGCKSIYETRFSMTAYAMVRKSHLPCDSADAQDWVASRVLRLISGTDPQFKTAIGVIAYEVVPSGYATEARYLPVNYEWAAVAIDVDVNISTSSEDGCYDTCATGDIPLPDFEPCVPCLTDVAVDGVTITGNGTSADPLVAIGGGGGTPLRTQEEGTNVSTNTTTLNFTGAGVTASLTSPGVVQVNVPGGGGGTQNLQDVTDLGNTTTNDIQFINAAEAIFGAGGGVLLDNASRLREGTIDAGLGGSKGIAQICAVGYELKWEAGRLYVMNGNGNGIRWSLYNFNITPTVNDDVTKGYAIGSLWSLDDNTIYLCSDASTGAAVWTLQSASVANLQDVTDIGNTTTNDLIVQGANDFEGLVSSQTITTYNTVSGAYAEMFVGTSGQLSLSDGTSAGILTINNLTSTNVQLEFPNKTTGTYTIATTADLTGGTVTDVTATAPISSSGGTTPDISITQADTTTDGYLSSADWNTFDGKFDTPTGTSSDYLDGTGAPTPFPALGMQGGQATGTDTYAVTIAGVTAYNLNDAYSIGFTNANTGASTLNINGLGAVNIAKNNVVPIIGGDIQANQQFIAIYDGSAFQILGIAPNQMFAYVTNDDSVTINRGQPVYSFGASGNRMSVKLANNSSEATSSRTLGLVFSTSIGANQKGYIITQGVIDGLNTNAYNPGDVLYVGNTAGSLTNVLPLAPNHYTRVGIVERANAGNGQIYVHVQNGFQLDELSDVDITTVTPVNNDFLVYTTGVNNLWKNRSLGNVLGGTTSQYVRGNGTLATFPLLIYKDLNNQTAVTGNTNNNKVVSVLIPANTITVGNIIEIKARAGKTGALGIATLRVYANTADSIVSPAPTLLTTTALASIATNYIGIDRTAIVKSATITQTAQANASIPTDAAVGTASLTNSNIDWTVNQYIIFALQNGAAGDSTVLSYYQIEIK
jgi:hypothetical protein